MSDMYGFESTEDVQYSSNGLPVGQYKAMVVGEEADEKGRGVVCEFEVLEGEHKGLKGKSWFLTKHTNDVTARIAREKLKRIADATGKPINAANPIKGRVLTLLVAEQKNNPDYTEIKKFMPENEVAAPF